MKKIYLLLLIVVTVGYSQTLKAQSLIQSFIETNCNGRGFSNFGCSVSSAGDVNGDGFDDVMVGANEYNYNQGAAYLYFGGNTMDSIADIIMYGETSDNYFGESLARAGDLNNDGYDDIIIGAHGYNNKTGRVYVYYGSSIMNSKPDLILTGETSLTDFGISLASVGDVNHDGYDDVIIGAPTYLSQGRAYIYFGGDRMNNSPDFVMTGNSSELHNENFGRSVSGAGDVNNDGFDDFVIGDKYYAYIYYGRETLLIRHDLRLTPESMNDNFGRSLSGAGDVNNDGYDDVIIGASSFNSGTGRAYLYFGGSNMDIVADITFTGSNLNDEFGNLVFCAGDVNNDGYDDVLIKKSYDVLYLYFGGSEMDNISDIQVTAEIHNLISASSSGDVNNDGYDDIIMASYCYQFSGKSWIYFGGNNVDNIADVTITGEIHDNDFGIKVANAGDVNKDGFDDLLVGAPGYNRYIENQKICSYAQGIVYLYYGGENFDNTPDLVFKGNRLYNRFGLNISSAGDLNGDGYSDIVISGEDDNCADAVFIYYGGAIMDTTPDLLIEGLNYSTYYFGNKTFACNLNGDEYDDLVVNGIKSTWSGNKGMAYLYYGGNIMDNQCDLYIEGFAGTSNTFPSIASSGDVNNDGFDDIIFGDPNYLDDYSDLMTFIYYGGSNMDNKADVTLTSTGRFGYNVASAGDVNNDGYDDVIVGAYGSYSSTHENYNGCAIIYLGGNDMDSLPDVDITYDDNNNIFGCSFASLGDINNDGFDDVMIADTIYNNHAGRVYIYYGGANMDNIADDSIYGEVANNVFGCSMSSLGDINGDGFSEVAIGASGFAHNGKVYIYSFNPYPSIETLAITDVKATDAIGNATITSTGSIPVISYGLCWNKTGEPTLGDSFTEAGNNVELGGFTSKLANLQPGTTYFVRSFIANSSNLIYGSTVTFKTQKQTQTITFEPLDEVAISIGSFELIATSTFGLPVTFTSSNTNVATINGNIVTLVDVGTTIITASQTGNDSILPATNVERELIVSLQGSISIESDILLKIYPNPANNTLFVNLPQAMQQALVEIYNTNGVKLQVQKIYGQLTKIDVSNLEQGLYFIKLSSEQKTQITRFVKQ
jgi:hypothetical protein